MATIEELKLWCNTSRRLLKTKGKRSLLKSDQTKDLKKHVQGVFALLQQIEGDRGLIKLYQDSVKTLEQLQRDMDQAAKTDGAGNTDKKNEAQTRLAGRFTTLETTLKTAADKRKLELESLKKRSEARGAYMQDYLAMLQRVELLKVMPKSTATNADGQLKTIHDQAQQQDTVEGYATARKALKAVETEVDKQTSVAEDLREQELAHWKAKPAAQQRLQEAESLYAELQQLVGIEATLKQYRDVLDAARRLTAIDDWTGVQAKLLALDKLPTPRQCQDDSAKQARSLQTAPRYGEGQGYLEKLASMLPEPELAKLKASYNAAANGYLQTKDGTALSLAVDALISQLDQVEPIAKEMRGLSGDVQVLLGRFKLLSSKLSVITHQTDLDNVEALRSNKQLAQATTLGLALKARLQAAIPGCEKAKQAWLDSKAEAQQLEQALLGMLQSPCTVLPGRATVAMNLVGNTYTTLLEADHNWSQLAANVVQARTVVAELQRIADGYAQLSTDRKTADADILRQSQAIEPALTSLQQAVTKAAKTAGSKDFDATVAFKADIAAALLAWKKAMDSATDPEALASAKDTALQALAAVQETVVASAGTPGIARLLEGQARADARPEFERLMQSVDLALERVQARDNGTAAKLLVVAGKLRSTGALNYKQAVVDATKLLEEAQLAVRFTNGMGDSERQAVAQLAADVRAEIERVKKDSKGNAKVFGPAFALLATELAELELMGTSTNLDALNDTTAALRALKQRATKFAPTTPGAGTSMDKVAQALADALDALDLVTPELKTNNPKWLVTLSQRATILQDEVYAAEPEAAMLKIAAFSKSVSEADTNAKVVKDLRSQYKALLPTIKSGLDAFVDRQVAPEYAAELTGRLKAIETLAQTPDKMYEALTKLKALDKDVLDASLNLQVAMGKEQGVRERQHQDEVTVTQWKQSLAVFEARHMTLAQAAVSQKDGDTALLLELQRMANMARQSAKDKDFGKALQQIRLTMERADQIVADPHGPAIGSRNNLPQDARVYRDALQAFSAGLDAVFDLTAKAVPALAASGNAAGAKFNKLLQSVKAKFDPNVFEGAIARLTAKDSDDTERRAAREAALAKVRSVQAALQQNPQIVSLLGNPVAKSEFSLVYRRLMSSLTRLDANIQRCCR